jgi:hypothetical protein
MNLRSWIDFLEFKSIDRLQIQLLPSTMESSYPSDGIKPQSINPADSISQFSYDKVIRTLDDASGEEGKRDSSVDLEQTGIRSTNLIFIKNNDQKHTNLAIARDILKVLYFHV